MKRTHTTRDESPINGSKSTKQREWWQCRLKTILDPMSQGFRITIVDELIEFCQYTIQSLLTNQFNQADKHNLISLAYHYREQGISYRRS